jgi:hypothetical protein
LLTLDLVVFCFQVFDLDPFSHLSVCFPASQCPVIGVTGHPAGFAKVRLLFWRGIQPDHMGAIHVIPLAFLVFSEDEKVLAVQADQSSPPCFHGIRPQPI